MSKSKKISIICVVLVVVLTLAIVLPIVLIKPKPDPKEPTTPQTPTTPTTPVEFVYEMTEDGKYIYFGEYPQSIKATDVTVSDTPDADGYYLGSDGERYLKHVVQIDYEAAGMDEQTIYDMGFADVSNGTTMTIGETYYFKMEKLKWRILSQADGTALIVCDTIIQGKTYQPNYVYSSGSYYATDDQGTILTQQDGSTQVYANNYQYSELRRFLTQDFYNSAFSAKQKEMIQLTTVDNSAATTNNANNPYACDNTQDYIFALSYADMINQDYGFSTTAGEQDINRKWNTTDFAKATSALTITKNFIINGQGVAEGSDEYNMYAPYIGSGAMWLRSPDSASTHYASGVSIGYSVSVDYVYFPNFGVVPALQISLAD